jgi:hypothetical protein
MLLAAAVFLAVSARAADDERARLANGQPLRGTVVQAKEEGLEVNTPQGVKVFSWEKLSAATRYRYQPAYRANFGKVLEGEPASAWTPAEEES